MALTPHVQNGPSGHARAVRLLALAALAASLAACADRVVQQTGSIYPMDYRERHPIALVQTPVVLDVLVRGVGLDSRQRTDVADFAEAYREGGSGAMHVQVPQGGDEVGTRRTLQAVRETLTRSGVPAQYVSISTYQPGNAEIAAAIRLSYRTLQAQVQSRCGLWPQDIGVSDVAFSMRNEPYWNHGCAMQNNIAAQTADPVDLVRARTPGPVDLESRLPDVRAVRAGEYPATNFPDTGP